MIRHRVAACQQAAEGLNAKRRPIAAERIQPFQAGDGLFWLPARPAGHRSAISSFYRPDCLT